MLVLLLAAWRAPEGWMFWLRPTTTIFQGGIQCTQGRVWVLALSSLQCAGGEAQPSRGRR